MLTNAVTSISTLLILIATGACLQGRDWFKNGGGALFSKFTVKIAIPVNMVLTVYNSFQDKGELWQILSAVPIPFCSTLLIFFAAFLVSRLFHVRNTRRGAFLASSSIGNSIFIGLPVIQALFGPEATPVGMVCYMANTLIFWTLGLHFLYRDNPENQSSISWRNLKKLFAPPFVGFLLGVLVVAAGIQFPPWLLAPIKSLSQTATPLAMLYIGSMVRSSSLGRSFLSRDVLLVMGMRLILAPLLTLLLCMPLPIPSETKQIFFIFSAMPSMTQIAIMAGESGSNSVFASMAVSATTLLGLVSIPLYVLFLQTVPLFW